MISILDVKAYLVKGFFNTWGSLGGGLLNFGWTRGLEVHRNLPYGPRPQQRLDILSPKTGKGPHPALIYFHGGGWISANKRIYRGIAARFSKSGLLTFNVDYRLAPGHRFPAALQDAALAIDWVRRNLRGYGGTASAIFIGGDSAGAQIAAWYACAIEKDSLWNEGGIGNDIRRVTPKGLLLFYGVYDFSTVQNADFRFIRLYTQSFLGGDAESYSDHARIASPALQLPNTYPPVFICAGERDGLYPQSFQFAEQLSEQGIECQRLLLPKSYRANHGFLFFSWLQTSKLAYSQALAFLKRLTGIA